VDASQAQAARLFDEWLETIQAERLRIRAARSLGPAQQAPQSRTKDADALDRALARINGLDNLHGGRSLAVDINALGCRTRWR
jgi:hypothetical protein